MANITKEMALDYHQNERPGKIEIVPTKPYSSQLDLSLAYSPGVAYPCKEIEATPHDAYKYTNKGNIMTNAEVVYQYITDQEDFKEDHTALSDAIIESEILARIFANGCSPMKAMYFPYRLIPKEYRTIKRVA